MTTRYPGDLRLPDSVLHRPLYDQFVDMMPPDDASPRVSGRLRGRKDLLPHRLAIGVGILAFQCIWQVAMPGTCLQILCM